ncbi:aspartate ammonia-lyase [Liquorilactobacillus satsumensis]|uniref:aspartate ammonia-lyase n=1 Tax=Liquorilactobacillus satsumensis TaxID=259059 RepID=UPI0021C27D7C|nr:aspartate ammonia-lyase [Liquorilactobacillus satsumensis]MCP9311914.1 aspartate ammonia-lyase [Liquorilactobacillus satsumensis]MCP9359047.1 aspartate ammonia-lyase [Liquorilactobacillus satsumensis]
MRIEKDSIGTVEIPDKAYFGIHSKRAQLNFPITDEKVHPLLLKNLLLVKIACAQANYQAHNLSYKKYHAITTAGAQIYTTFPDYQAEFITPAIQGGAGTSTNMNVNEVIANRALELLGHSKGDYAALHPNDDVNRGQSTNDVYPTGAHLALLQLNQMLAIELEKVIAVLKQLSDKYQNTLKLGRTQLEDAVPTTYGTSFNAYAHLFTRALQRIKQVHNSLLVLPLGGTAIGTGITANPEYLKNVVPLLSKIVGLPLKQADNLSDAIQNTDCFLMAADAFKNLAVALSKMCNDLRLLGSGPRAGLGELALPKVQAGSSIMPGKVNPVIPEAINQIAFQVCGYNATITMCSEAGQLELNAFEPVMFRDLFSAAELLQKGLKMLKDGCLTHLKVNQAHCAHQIEESAEIATVLAPKIGYVQATLLVKTALQQKVSIRKVLKEHLKLSATEIENLLAPESLLGCLHTNSISQPAKTAL